MKVSKYWSLKENGTSYKEKIHYTDNCGKSDERYSKILTQIGQGKETLIPISA